MAASRADHRSGRAAIRGRSSTSEIGASVTVWFYDEAAPTEQAVAAVGPAAGVERQAIRTVAVARFGVDRMVDEYLAAYGQLLHGR